MFDQKAVDLWLGRFLTKLKNIYGNRLVYVGCHASWARGEAEPTSDIDATLVLDQIGPSDMTRFGDIVAEMPEAERVGSGFFVSVPELQAWPGWELLQFYYGCKPLHGFIKSIVPELNSEDLIIETSDNSVYEAWQISHIRKRYRTF